MRGQNIMPIAARDFLGREQSFHPVPVWTDEPKKGPDGVVRLLLRVGTGAAELSTFEAETLISQLVGRIEAAKEMSNA